MSEGPTRSLAPTRGGGRRIRGLPLPRTLTIRRVEGRKRLPHGEQPAVELVLEPSEKLIEFHIEPEIAWGKRKTRDWRWWALISRPSAPAVHRPQEGMGTVGRF